MDKREEALRAVSAAMARAKQEDTEKWVVAFAAAQMVTVSAANLMEGYLKGKNMDQLRAEFGQLQGTLMAYLEAVKKYNFKGEDETQLT